MIYSSTTVVALVAVCFALPVQANDLWQVVDADSALNFTLDIGGTQTVGGFDKWSAQINYDPETPEDASVHVAIDVASAYIGNTQAMPLISSPTWFETKVHPTATFSGNGFAVVGEGLFSMDGLLTLKGVDGSVTLVGEIAVVGDVATARFQTDLARNNYGVGDANPAVSASIEVTADIVALRAAP